MGAFIAALYHPPAVETVKTFYFLTLLSLLESLAIGICIATRYDPGRPNSRKKHAESRGEMLPYKLHTVGDIIIVEITGLGLMEGPELDRMAAHLREELMRSKDKRMVLDCQRLRTIASVALGVMVTLSRLADQHKGGFVVCGLQAQLKPIFRIAGLDRQLQICGTREEAIAKLVEPAGGTL